MSPIEVAPEIRSTVKLWAETERPLIDFQEMLVKRGEIEPGKARSLVEDLLTTLLDNAEHRYIEELGAEVGKIVEIRSRLKAKYDSLLEFFDPKRRSTPLDLPAELQPSAFDELFTDLDKRLEAIRQNTVEGAMDALTDPEYLEDVKQELGEPKEEEPEVKPTLDLDRLPKDPDWLPGHEESQRIERDLYNELKRLHPEDPKLRAHVEAVAKLWGKRNLPPGYEVIGVQRVPDYGVYRAQTEAFGAIDPVFAGRGYELIIKTPNGELFRADALGAKGEGYAFYERKSPLGDQPSGYYNSQRGRVELFNKMIENAKIARDLQGNGCGGWVYETGQPWLDASLTEMIRYIRGEIGLEELGLDPSALNLYEPDMAALGKFLIPPGEAGVP
jgi:polyhydroxyalkanoate synthesis regulator phasin